MPHSFYEDRCLHPPKDCTFNFFLWVPLLMFSSFSLYMTHHCRAVEKSKKRKQCISLHVLEGRHAGLPESHPCCTSPLRPPQLTRYAFSVFLRFSLAGTVQWVSRGYIKKLPFSALIGLWSVCLEGGCSLCSSSTCVLPPRGVSTPFFVCSYSLKSLFLFPHLSPCHTEVGEHTEVP